MNGRSDEISTLGESTLWDQDGSTIQSDAHTVSIQSDSEYLRAHKAAHGHRKGSLKSVYEEDEESSTPSAAFSLEEIMSHPHETIDVRVPPGKLGIVMDSSASGHPMIYSVKPGSAMEGQVEMGDRLIQVDNMDVSRMTAREVAELITDSRKQERRMVFVRPT